MWMIYLKRIYRRFNLTTSVTSMTFLYIHSVVQYSTKSSFLPRSGHNGDRETDKTTCDSANEPPSLVLIGRRCSLREPSGNHEIDEDEYTVDGKV